MYNRAIVIGGSMVGLAVARALSETFREVVVIDKDQFPVDAPEHRPGAQQSWHIHNLTLRGQNELEELFPGFVDEAIRLGAMQVDYADDIARCSELGWMPRFESGFIALSATRALLEFAERQRFRALVKNATVLESTRPTELLSERIGERFQAVGVRTSEGRELRAELVVDCSGRAAVWKKWYAGLGVAPPRETVVDSQCGYSSRFYRPRDPARFSWKGMVVDAVYPEKPHWGVIVPLEQNDWVVTLGGFGGEYPPSDEEGFLRFARCLRSPDYVEALEQAEPITPVRTFRRMEMRWSHFEQHDHPISRLLVIGDAAWAYNPLYGQGMSIGVTCARLLRDALRDDPELDGLPRRYYPPARRFAFPPWEATALRDMRWPRTSGARPWHGSITLPLSEFIMRAGHHDNEVFKELLLGIHLLKQPHELFTPSFVLRILRYGLKQLAARDSLAGETAEHAAPRVAETRG
jgi:2-polyprenyl-6-methoxyphenol hydroxylase-like FAD-dependent oxidoreductase